MKVNIVGFVYHWRVLLCILTKIVLLVMILITISQNVAYRVSNFGCPEVGSRPELRPELVPLMVLEIWPGQEKSMKNFKGQ